MLITRVEPVPGSRVRVYMEDRTVFVLSRREAERFGVRQGEFLAEASYREILEKLLPRRAKLRCLHLLQQRDYTERQLARKLSEGGYPEETAREAVSDMVSSGYVKDRAYAMSYLRQHRSGMGRFRMEQELLRRGISRQMVDECFAELDREEPPPDEGEVAAALLAKKHCAGQNLDQRGVRRLAAYLMRQGISAGTVRHVLGRDFPQDPPVPDI